MSNAAPVDVVEVGGTSRTGGSGGGFTEAYTSLPGWARWMLTAAMGILVLSIV